MDFLIIIVLLAAVAYAVYRSSRKSPEAPNPVPVDDEKPSRDRL